MPKQSQKRNKRDTKLILTPKQRKRLNAIGQAHLLPNMNAQKLQDIFNLFGVVELNQVLWNIVTIEEMIKKETGQNDNR